MERAARKQTTLKLVQLAILTAIIILMGFTPIGFLKVGAIEITFIVIPVAIGAIIVGPLGGAILGGVFGLVSFAQCFGMSFFGTALFAVNPFFTFVLCLVPRVLMGWLCGLIFRALSKVDKTKIFSFGIASLSAALLNTILFISGFLLLFGHTTFYTDLRAGKSLMSFIVWFVGLNGLVEAIVCTIIGFAISKALVRFLPTRLIGDVKN